jgi:8-oxo-dGTP pyrophosphatase MutT (NUDIX family)
MSTRSTAAPKSSRFVNTATLLTPSAPKTPETAAKRELLEETGHIATKAGQIAHSVVWRVVLWKEVSLHQFDENVQHLDVQLLNAIGIGACWSANVDVTQGLKLRASFAFAVRATFKTFLLVPLVLSANKQSPSRPCAST